MKFEIYRSGVEWRWRLNARNGETIASGEGYKNKDDCITVIDLVRSVETRMASIDDLSKPIRKPITVGFDPDDPFSGSE